MGLTAGEYKCLNCGNYEFDKDDLVRKSIKTDEKRGYIQIPVDCINCNAGMLYIFFQSRKLQPAIAYRHTCNDEPCYSKTCRLCYGCEALHKEETSSLSDKLIDEYGDDLSRKTIGIDISLREIIEMIDEVKEDG